MKNKIISVTSAGHFLKSAILKSFILFFLVVLGTLTVFGQSSKQLSIKPVLQQTQVWCWAAVAEMTFKHYNLPNLNQNGNFQCGIVAIYFGKQSPCWYDCSKCITTIGVFENIHKLVNEYGLAIRQESRPSRNLNSQLVRNPMSFQNVKNEIDNNRPILAGIKRVFGNQSQHVTLIIGYQTSNNRNYLIVNDPFPFEIPNPYFEAGAIETQKGQYKITYKQFINSLEWNNSIYNIVSDTNPSITFEEPAQQNCFEECIQVRVNKCIKVCVDQYGQQLETCKTICQLDFLTSNGKTNRQIWNEQCRKECETNQNASNSNDGFCTSINTIVNDVKNSFKNIKTGFNTRSSDCNIYNSSIKIPGSSKKNEIWFCQDSKYFTAKLYQGNDYDDALQVFQNISDELKNCFADSNPVESETSNPKMITLYTSEARIIISIFEYKRTYNVSCDIRMSE